jgi:hypothetical protein
MAQEITYCQVGNDHADYAWQKMAPITSSWRPFCTVTEGRSDRSAGDVSWRAWRLAQTTHAGQR